MGTGGGPPGPHDFHTGQPSEPALHPVAGCSERLSYNDITVGAILREPPATFGYSLPRFACPPGGFCWGQAPALHFSCDPGLSLLGDGGWCRPAGAGIHPGSESRTCFPTNRPCRLSPAHQGMKSGSCGLVQRIGTVDSAEPHPDPCGGQAPRLAKSSTALHFLIPPSAVGLQFGTFRPWRAGIEVDWRAHPGSESGTCFRTNRSCRLSPAHQGVKIGCIG